MAVRTFLVQEPLAFRSIPVRERGLHGDFDHGDEVKFCCPGCSRLLTIRRRSILPVDPRTKSCPRCHVAWRLVCVGDEAVISGELVS